jgi:transcriptional regulator with XRE-family HTH domain
VTLDTEITDALKSWGEKLRRYRVKTGRAVEDLAEEAGIGRQHWHSVESGEKVSVPLGTFVRMLRACGVPFSEFLRGMSTSDIPFEDQPMHEMLADVLRSGVPSLRETVSTSLKALSMMAAGLKSERSRSKKKKPPPNPALGEATTGRRSKGMA